MLLFLVNFRHHDLFNFSDPMKPPTHPIFEQLPHSSSKMSGSKLLPYDKSLTECFETEEKGKKLKCKLCGKQLVDKKNEKTQL